MKNKPEPQEIHTEGHMVMALRDHFHAPEYVVLPQVRNGVGFSSNRTADALVMSVWPSRGLHLYGIEIKVSRSDWMREMKDPKKADDIGKFCDFWVLAAGKESIVKDGELPPGWGLLVPGKKVGTLKMSVPPQRIEHVEQISRSFLAAILRKAFEATVPLKEVEDEITRRVNEKVQELETVVTNRIIKDLDTDRLLKRNKELEDMAAAFEEASGCWMGTSISEAKRLGAAMKVLAWSGIGAWIERNIGEMKRNITSMEDLLAALPTETEDPWD
jgi:hypothetical protein